MIGFATGKYYSNYQRDVKQGLLQKAYFQNSPLTEEDIKSLPESVKNYLRYTGSIGKPKVNNFEIQFHGKLRKDEHPSGCHLLRSNITLWKPPPVYSL
jgi:hypothetical protein